MSEPHGAADAVLDEINERAVEAALLIKEKEEAEGGAGKVVVLTLGPERAGEAIRKALSMGADEDVHVLDDRVAGSARINLFMESGGHVARNMVRKDTLYTDSITTANTEIKTQRPIKF